MVGDSDGVVVVPRLDAAEVLEKVGALVERERKRIEEIKGGAVFKSEINETLKKKGVLHKPKRLETP